MLPSRNSFYPIAMSLLWSLWMISTAQAVPFPVNTIQTGMVTDGNNVSILCSISDYYFSPVRLVAGSSGCIRSPESFICTSCSR
ncbi:hypothetical protein F5050DRAFT_1194768 [Lentinula boryana]|uniref:Uncharacterized protein n=1 Tax=Lentinula boryana TaxID=40481 RepID=A0ABQ8QJR5_9AGAR|nr:hypothetical protein F5050DRAFT_1194768 [Lentinula boryana]